MGEFKVGDTVKYFAYNKYAQYESGLIGKITEPMNSRAKVLWENGVTSWHSSEFLHVIDSPNSGLTGGSSDYYKLEINGVVVECNDIIKALGLNFAQGNVFKAVWRIGADNIGKGKPGNTRLYNAEKVVFFGNDMVEMEKAQANG